MEKPAKTSNFFESNKDLISGVSSIQIFPSSIQRRSYMPNASDKEALRGDWIRLGNDWTVSYDSIRKAKNQR